MRKRKVQSYEISGSEVTALHSEDGFDLKALGPIVKAEKISDVRFNVKRQMWEAVDRKTGRVIARDASRSACVALEHDHYEKMISAGKIPWRR